MRFGHGPRNPAGGTQHGFTESFKLTFLETLYQQQRRLKIAVEPDGAAGAASHAIAVEETADGDWRVVEGWIDESGVTVSKAYRIAADEDGAANLNGHTLSDGNRDRIVCFIPDARQSVCRLLDMPDVPQAQLDQMVSLRLEVELPYPPKESTWACRRLPAPEGEAGPVLLIAQAAKTIAEGEARLADRGVDGTHVVFASAALVELSRMPEDGDATIATAKIDRDRGTLAIGRGGALCYARHLRLLPERVDGNGASEQWLHGLARELKQCLFDYTSRTGCAAPVALRIEGEGILSEDDCIALETSLELAVTLIAPPPCLSLADPEAIDGDLAAEYALATGALLGLYRERAGMATAAPALRTGGAGGGLRLKRSTARLLAINVGLAAVLIASLFFVRSIQLASADRFVRESKAMVRDMEVLKEEVDILRYEEGQQISMLDILMALSEVLPPELKVETMNLDTKGTVVLSGTTKSVEAVSDGVKEALKKSPRFKNPQFKGATQGKGGYGFTLTFELAGGGS